MIMGANCLVSVAWDGDFRESSQAAAQTPLFQGGSLSSLPNMDCLFSLFAGDKKTCVCSSVSADQLQDWEASFSALWALICLWPCWWSLASSAFPLPILFLHRRGCGLQNPLPYHPLCLQCHWLLVLLPWLSKSDQHSKLLGHTFMRFKLEHLPNQRGVQGLLPGLQPSTSDFPTRAPGKS